MSMATFSGPVRSGTVRYGAGTNTGVTVLAQSVNVVATTLTGNAFTLPAGSQILSATFYTTTLFNAATTAKLTIGATDITAAVTVTAAGAYTLTFAAGGIALINNVGTSDVTVTYTLAGTIATGNGTIVIQYAQRNADGSQAPAYNQN
jgi:hypothetical protein